MVARTDEEYAELVSTLDMPIEATSTYDKWQTELEEELGMRYSSDLGEKTWGGIEILYEKLPEAGLAYRRVEMKWGYQGQYISVDPALTGYKAGTIMSFERVKEVLGGL